MAPDPAWLSDVLTTGQLRLPRRMRWLKALAAVSGLTATQRLVAHTVALHFDADGDGARLSIPTLAAEAGLGERATRAALAAVVAAGWLDRRGGRRGPGGSYHYTATFPQTFPHAAPRAASDAARRAGSRRDAAPDDSEMRHLTTRDAAPGAAKGVEEYIEGGPRSAREARLYLVAAGVLKSPTPPSARQPPLLSPLKTNSPPPEESTPPPEERPPHECPQQPRSSVGDHAQASA